MSSLLARIKRIERQRRIARLVLRALRLTEVEVLPIGEYAVAFGYVGLSNDMRAVVNAARLLVEVTADPEPERRFDALTPQRAHVRLAAELAKFDRLYPDQPR